MKEWTILEERGGDYVMLDENGDTVIVDTAYYPTAPSIVRANFIVEAVNFYRRHLEQNAEVPEDDE